MWATSVNPDNTPRVKLMHTLVCITSKNARGIPGHSASYDTLVIPEICSHSDLLQHP